MNRYTTNQCCDQLTAVKTGFPLTSITWPYRGLRCRPIDVEYLLKLSADKLLVFKWSRAQVYFSKFIWNMLCLRHNGPALLRFWFQTDLGRENSASYLKIQAGKDFFLPWSRSTSNFHALIGQILTGEFMRKIHAASLNLLALTAEADRVLCQLVMFLTVFFQNEIQLLSRVFCYSWLVCLLGFWLRNASLAKVENPISDGTVFVFHLFWWVKGKRREVSSDSGLTW